MPKIAVRLYTTLKDIAQTGRVELESQNVAEALEQLSSKFGPRFFQTIYDAEQSQNKNKAVRNCFSIVVNSQMVGLKNLDQKEFKEGDIVHIFPPIAGGSKKENLDD